MISPLSLSLPLAKTGAKWPKMIGFRIFKSLWNRLDEPDPTVSQLWGHNPPGGEN